MAKYGDSLSPTRLTAQSMECTLATSTVLAISLQVHSLPRFLHLHKSFILYLSDNESERARYWLLSIDHPISRPFVSITTLSPPGTFLGHFLPVSSINSFCIFSFPFYFYKNTFSEGYVRSVLGNSRSIMKNEAQLLASALRSNYGKMFSSMIRKYFSLVWPPPCFFFKI